MLARYTSTPGKDTDRAAIARRVARQRELRAIIAPKSTTIAPKSTPKKRIA